MARVFISHSSRDNASAKRIMDWLIERGFETPFLDFDKHAGIPPGANWEQTLYREIDLSDAVVLIQTPNWLESKWCFAEFTQARALGKAVFPVIETPTGDTLIAPDIQTLDLTVDEEGGLERLARELSRIALDAQGGFDWDRSRPPYPGLLAFQEEDAAVYFGRDDEIRRLIERLRARRAQGGTKLIALLGASGSGKSSLLRAGVIPRLKRAGGQWIVLPPMRPQARPIDELAKALAIGLASPGEWQTIRTALTSEDRDGALRDLADRLLMREGNADASILLPLDQGEELWGAADPAQATRFCEVLSDMLGADLPFLCVLAMRSDFLGSLQAAGSLTARYEEFSLSPMPLTRIPQIIEGPARVGGFGIDEELVRQAALEAETEDALPLLAFALRELYDASSGDDHLSIEEYRALGDPTLALSPLENAVRRAADQVIAEIDPDRADLRSLRDAFLPHMVRINDQGEYVRRPAQWVDLPTKAYPLLQALATARLLTIREGDEGRVVEVSHEALLRKWPLLRGWLDEDREFLLGKRQLETDFRDWQAAPEAQREGALLSGLKLNRAEAWLTARPHQLTSGERELIRASLERRSTAQKKARRRRITTAVLAVAAVIAGVQWTRARGALRQAERAMVQANNAVLQADRAAQNRTEDQTRFVWTDLYRAELEQQRLEEVANSLGVRAEAILARPEEQQIDDRFDCAYTDIATMRSLYCAVRTVINLERVEALAGMPVYRPGGPHQGELNVEADTFGHYNPAFLDWVEANLIRDYSGDPLLRRISAFVYEARLKDMVRALYHTHILLFSDDEDFDLFADHRRTLVRGASRDLGTVSSGRFNWLIGREGEARWQGSPVLPDERLPLVSNEETPWWLLEYLGAVGVESSFFAHSAGRFWARRVEDGTEEQFFRIVRQVLSIFEPGFIEDECLLTVVREGARSVRDLRARGDAEACSLI